MKTTKLLVTIGTIGLTFGLLTGCGGGNGDSNGQTTPTAELTETKVNDFMKNTSDVVGCDYTTDSSAVVAKKVVVPVKAVNVLKRTVVKASLLKFAQLNTKTTQEQNGTCGGTLTMVTSDDNKTVDLTFAQYCNDELSGESATVDGALTASIDQQETSMTLSATTPTPLTVQAVNPNTSGEDIDVTIDLDDGEVTINMDANTNDLTTVTASAKTISLTDNVSQKNCTITDLDASIDMQTEETTVSAGVDCTDLDGKVDVEATADSSGEGSVTLTDASGQKAVITPTTTTGVFNVALDNSSIASMDCSTVELPDVEL